MRWVLSFSQAKLPWSLGLLKLLSLKVTEYPMYSQPIIILCEVNFGSHPALSKQRFWLTSLNLS